jgi:hypothetical protein
MGERIRITPGGDVYEVVRVTPCAAYIQRVWDPPKRVEVVAHDGTVRVIWAKRGPIEPGIATHSFVYRT